MERPHPSNRQINEDLLRPILHTSWRFYAATLLLGLSLLAAVLAWSYQIHRGIGVAGIRYPVMWAFYITNFVFWIGISHAGTLISAILRLVNAGWRRPITRCAEAITVFALMIGSMFPIIHLGRPWLFFWLIPYPNERLIWPNFRSPLMWDFMAINTYLIGSVTYLYLPMVPDLAAVRDRSRGLRRKIYSLLALGWQGTATQWNRLERAISIMAVIIVPVAVSVHTIVSWDFAMTLNPMWKSTIFGPYFVVGAIFSGIAALILAMAVLRKILRLEEYLKPLHFDNLSVFKERIYLDKTDPNVLHDEITVIDNALTRPWTVDKKYMRKAEPHPDWVEAYCVEGTALVGVGKEIYYLSGDGFLMPSRKGQAAPDLRYFDAKGK